MDVMNAVDSISEALSGHSIMLRKITDNTGIFDDVDAFVKLSRDNATVHEVVLYPVIDIGNDASGTCRYAIWDRIAEGIGNLQALREITIGGRNYYDDEGRNMFDDEENWFENDWEILACILRRLRRGIVLSMEDDSPLLWDAEALPVFAEVIHEHAMITGFSTGIGCPFHCLDILCSALLTLPALEKLYFDQFDYEGPEEERSLESMVKLLQSPSLRKVTFKTVVLTNILCQAIAEALKEWSEITDLYFMHRCSFPEGEGGAVIARALKTNTTLTRLGFYTGADEAFYEVLAAALISNSTLNHLSLDDSGCGCTLIGWLYSEYRAEEACNL
jgi:hypothetical protein